MQQVSSAPLEHLGENSSHDIYVRHDIDIPGALLQGVRHGHVAADGDSSVETHKVDGSECGICGRDESLYLGFIGNIELKRESADLVGDGGGGFTIDVGNDDSSG